MRKRGREGGRGVTSGEGRVKRVVLLVLRRELLVYSRKDWLKSDLVFATYCQRTNRQTDIQTDKW